MLRKSWVVILVLIGISWTARKATAQSDGEQFSCSVEAVWINCWAGLNVSPGSGRTVTLHLRSHVGQGSCLPAKVSLMAAYLDRQGEVLCVGTQEEIATLTENVQDAAIEMNPLVLGNFSRWRNRPGQRMDPMFEPLECRAPDGRSALLDNHLDSAVSVEIAATVLPTRGGLSVAECQVGIMR